MAKDRQWLCTYRCITENFIERKEIYKQKEKTDAAVTTSITLNIKTLKNPRTTLPLPTYPKRVKQNFFFFFFSTWS